MLVVLCGRVRFSSNIHWSGCQYDLIASSHKWSYVNYTQQKTQKMLFSDDLCCVVVIHVQCVCIPC